MNEEYIKKLEEDNKRLEETLVKYIDRYGELKPIVLPPVEVKPSDTVTFGKLSGMNVNVAQMTPSNIFQVKSQNGNICYIYNRERNIKTN